MNNMFQITPYKISTITAKGSLIGFDKDNKINLSKIEEYFEKNWDSI